MMRRNMARAGPVSSGGGGLGPARFGSYSYRAGTMRRFHPGRCDRRHKSNFRYPIIFWTASDGRVLINAQIAAGYARLLCRYVTTGT